MLLPDDNYDWCSDCWHFCFVFFCIFNIQCQRPHIPWYLFTAAATWFRLRSDSETLKDNRDVFLVIHSSLWRAARGGDWMTLRSVDNPLYLCVCSWEKNSSCPQNYIVHNTDGLSDKRWSSHHIEMLGPDIHTGATMQKKNQTLLRNSQRNVTRSSRLIWSPKSPDPIQIDVMSNKPMEPHCWLDFLIHQGTETGSTGVLLEEDPWGRPSSGLTCSGPARGCSVRSGFRGNFTVPLGSAVATGPVLGCSELSVSDRVTLQHTFIWKCNRTRNSMLTSECSLRKTCFMHVIKKALTISMTLLLLFKMSAFG